MKPPHKGREMDGWRVCRAGSMQSMVITRWLRRKRLASSSMDSLPWMGRVKILTCIKYFFSTGLRRYCCSPSWHTARRAASGTPCLAMARTAHLFLSCLLFAFGRTTGQGGSPGSSTRTSACARRDRLRGSTWRCRTSRHHGTRGRSPMLARWDC